MTPTLLGVVLHWAVQVFEVVVADHPEFDAHRDLSNGRQDLVSVGVAFGGFRKYDYLNYFMGWDDDAVCGGRDPIWMRKGVAARLCGHTHRFKAHLTLGLPPLINVSGQGQPRIFEV